MYRLDLTYNRNIRVNASRVLDQTANSFGYITRHTSKVAWDSGRDSDTADGSRSGCLRGSVF